MIKTKYGELSPAKFDRYKKSIINRIYAILPMKEEGVATTTDYIENLNRELINNLEIFEQCERVISVVCILEGLIKETDHEQYRKAVLHCCNVISRLGDN